MEAHTWTVVDVDMVHAARIGAHAATVIALEPSSHLTIFAARRVEVYGAARRMIAAATRSSDASAGTMCGNDLDRSELGADLI